MNNFQTRVLTASVALPIAVLAILFLPSLWFTLLIAAFVLVGSWEWITMMQAVVNNVERIGYVAATGLMLWLLWYQAFVPYDAIVLLALGWWLVALIGLVRYKRGYPLRLLSTRVAIGSVGWLLLLPTWLVLAKLHGEDEAGAVRILLLFAVVWLADSAAYLTGSLIGRHRLAPHISPGKTLEGVAGALIAVAILVSGIAIMAGLSLSEWLSHTVFWVVIAAFSVVGDLSVSLFKRQAGVKDSGIIFLGHGGVLDRIDSLCAAAPLYAVSFRLLY